MRPKHRTWPLQQSEGHGEEEPPGPSPEPPAAPAVLTGNRAGIVESANAEWTQLTDFPLEQTLQKPITHFLDDAGIDLEVVDLIGRNFLEGRPCSVQFPFKTARGRTLRIHLRVESLRDALGEIATFRATAQAVQPPSETSLLPPETRDAHTSKRSVHAPDHACAHRKERVDLQELASRVTQSWINRRHASVLLDTALADDLPALRSDAGRLEALLRHLLDSAGSAAQNTSGCITVLSGRTQQNRSHQSKAHPIGVRPTALAHGAYVFLEVHDTAPHLEPSALSRIQTEQPSPCPRERALASALHIAAEIGGSLHIDSTPGCGTQALVLFPN